MVIWASQFFELALKDHDELRLSGLFIFLLLMISSPPSPQYKGPIPNSGQLMLS